MHMDIFYKQKVKYTNEDCCRHWIKLYVSQTLVFHTNPAWQNMIGIT